MELNDRGTHDISFILEDIETRERFGGKILSESAFTPLSCHDILDSHRIVFECIEELDRTIQLLQEIRNLRDNRVEELKKN